MDCGFDAWLDYRPLEPDCEHTVGFIVLRPAGVTTSFLVHTAATGNDCSSWNADYLTIFGYFFRVGTLPAQEELLSWSPQNCLVWKRLKPKISKGAKSFNSIKSHAFNMSIPDPSRELNTLHHHTTQLLFIKTVKYLYLISILILCYFICLLYLRGKYCTLHTSTHLSVAVRSCSD